MNITFRGREVEVDEVCEGLVKKNDKTFYFKCKVTGEWLYSNASRTAKLIEKAGSQEEAGKNYLSRKGKAIEQMPKPDVVINEPAAPAATTESLPVSA